jgi:hypothetical protein
MSPILIVLIAITLGLLVLAMIALAMSGAFDPGLLMTFTTGAVLFGFVTGAVIEIRRVAGLDGPAHLKGAEEATFEVPGCRLSTMSRLLPEASTSDGKGDETGVPEKIVVEVGALDPPGAKPIVVESRAVSEHEMSFRAPLFRQGTPTTLIAACQQCWVLLGDQQILCPVLP